jgi:hypothetical protein
MADTAKDPANAWRRVSRPAVRPIGQGAGLIRLNDAGKA